MSERKRVLIVDDDPDFVAGIRAILDSQYDTVVAYNPKDGWDALKKDRYDLLCLDIMMGRGAEGVMMARKIRKDKVLREMPVLIITGLREQIAFLFPGQAVHPGFVPVDELVEKPVEPDAAAPEGRGPHRRQRSATGQVGIPWWSRRPRGRSPSGRRWRTSSTPRRGSLSSAASSAPRARRRVRQWSSWTTRLAS